MKKASLVLDKLGEWWWILIVLVVLIIIVYMIFSGPTSDILGSIFSRISIGGG
ncbi:hypothetical protein KY308_00215 [Candidatus Woesearchaeota archaeon]|nr:hypothetical protein [Candidatus Woesearchaeota archaeon]